MPISGLAITLCDECVQARLTIAELAAHPSIEIGEQLGNKIAIVTETASSADDQKLLNWINALAGVSFVDITFIAFDDNTQGVAVESHIGVAP